VCALIDGLVQAARDNDMELYGVHVYRRGAEPAERRLRSDDRVNLYSTSELARFGRLLLNDGRHDGRQLVPAGYSARIARETVPTVNDPDSQEFRLAHRYGLGAWRYQADGDGTFYMAGMYSQTASSPRPSRRSSPSPPTSKPAPRAHRSPP